MDDCVCVVGAGIAGLTAAATLQAQGFSVFVLEGRIRLGGRIWTDRSWGDTPLDLGASWIHGMRGNPIAALARKWRIPVLSTDYERPHSCILQVVGSCLRQSV